MDGVVLGRGDDAEIAGIVALHATDEGDGHAAGEEGVFSVGFLTAAPAGIAKDVDIRRPEGESEELFMLVVTNCLVVFCTGFGGDGLAHSVDELRIPGGGHADDLRKIGGVSGKGDAVKTLVPPKILRDAEARDGGSVIAHLGDFFVEGHLREQIVDALADIVGACNVDCPGEIYEVSTHDDSLGAPHVFPLAVVRPNSTEEVVAIVKAAVSERVPLVARGSGTGLSGACIQVEGSVVLSFERMNRIVEIDLANHVAIVEPGVTLAQLDEALRPEGLIYPVFPGEQSASLGGNVATNAGGMRAVKYGVTRHHVLGIEAVLGTGEVVVSGGKFVKSTSGYDLTQLVIGSEGTLALVTRAVLRLHPRPEHHSTLLAPFPTVRRIAEAVPRIVGGGISPLLVEYIDLMSMAGITAAAGIDLGIPDEVRAQTLAYLVVVLEDHHLTRLEEDTQAGRHPHRQVVELGHPGGGLAGSAGASLLPHGDEDEYDAEGELDGSRRRGRCRLGSWWPARRPVPAGHPPT